MMDRAFEAADLSMRLTANLRSKAALLSCYAAPNDAAEVSFDLRFFDAVFPVHMRKRDLATLSEIFYDRSYAIHTPLPKPPTIVDCGAGLGLTTIWFLARFPGARVHAFEEDEALFRFLELNVGGRNDVVANRGMADLSAYLGDRALPKIDVLKLDGDMRVVDTLGDRVLDVGVVVGVLEDRAAEPFYRYFEERGFRRVKREKTRHEGRHAFELAR